MSPADSPFASLPAPGPHPATAELRAYAAGTLSAADEHRIEAHALDCERCAELLEGFSMSDAATTDHALAELRTRLQARVADDLAAPLVPLPASRVLWPRLAAAVALLGAVGAGLWGWEHQRPAAAVAQAPLETAAPAPVSAPAPATPPAPIASAPPATVASAPAAPVAGVSAPHPADYAAGRAPARPGGPGPLRRPVLPTVPVLANQYPAAAEVATEATGSISEPAASEAKKLADREVAAAPTAAPAAEPATIAAAEDVAAPSKKPAASASAPSAPADFGAPGKDLATVSRASRAKAAENVAMVRVTDKPMPAPMAIAPAPVTGTPALRTYLHRQAAEFELEEGAKPMNGTVRLRFIVGADGKLSNLQVVRSLRADYDEEALRMICEGPAWRPGIAGGRRTALPMEINVSF